MFASCSTPSSATRDPVWVTAQCPPAVVQIDRSFATPPPVCISTWAEAAAKGESWGELLVDLGSAIALRDACAREVARWIESEQLAREQAEATS